MRYEPKDFENIDKQKEDIVYKSTLLPTEANYFYSVYQPNYDCFVWQSIDNFVEMRPKTKGIGNVKEEERAEEKNGLELELVDYESNDNKVREMIDDTVTTPLSQNWEVSRDEYLIHLAK